MRLLKNRLKLALVVSIFAGLALYLVLTFRPVKSSSSIPISFVASSVSTSKTAKAVYGLPVRLKIPAIKVNAALDYVSLTASGELGVPTVPANAAWYDQGPLPGEKGDSVIDGHYGWEDNIPAVFDNLSKVRRGDDLYVQDDHNVTTAFVVTSVQTLGENQSAKAIFISSDNKAHLNLITCGGAWSQAQQSYSERIVVFADKI